jgi:hypothetical protein
MSGWTKIVPQHAATGADGIPTFTADVGSAGFKGRVYSVWSEIQQGRHQVQFAASADNGYHWSKPSAISGAQKSDAFMPSVAVNVDGVVAVCWYDNRHAASASGDWDVDFRATLDGGANWKQSERVTEKTSRVGTSHDLDLGDTAGMTTDRDGAFHPTWVDNRTGVLQVWTATVVIERP